MPCNSLSDILNFNSSASISILLPRTLSSTPWALKSVVCPRISNPEKYPKARANKKTTKVAFKIVGS